MHSQLSDCVSSDGSMEHPISMKPGRPSSKRRRRDSNDPPDLMSDVTRLRNEFLKIYETDYPELQKCIDKLYGIVKTFEKNFREATARTRNGGVAAAVGAAGMLVGLALIPFTFGSSAIIFAAAVGGTAGAAATGAAAAGATAGAAAAAAGGIYGGLNSSKKTKQMSQLRNDIEAELKKFQDKINPMSEKMKDINERIEEILRDLDKLELEADEAGKDFGSRSLTRRIPREEFTALNAQISITMCIIGTTKAIFSALNIFFDLFSVIENTRELSEMDKLAKKPLNEPIDETEIKTKAGKFIAEMRKVIHQLEDIMEEIRISKDKLDNYIG